MSKTIELATTIHSVELERETTAIECSKCQGFAPQVDPTEEEILGKFNCGRPYACCVRVFVCNKCKQRFIGKAPAPEMD